MAIYRSNRRLRFASLEDCPVLKGNCIYFTDDFHFNYYESGGFDMGIFDLKEPTIQPVYSGKTMFTTTSRVIEWQFMHIERYV
ncbi:hypothetical protein GIB67_011243 [Kingdonia uniflora]|uniref:DUF295 domain-containing protein n=1 Tax=Kingdonia uniflora TaxID=39325 RepID=A0A7J7M4D0_9MAGN|nr:hypothetical protein GIB67_011243 [Kingdonia uniflora]